MHIIQCVHMLLEAAVLAELLSCAQISPHTQHATLLPTTAAAADEASRTGVQRCLQCAGSSAYTDGILDDLVQGTNHSGCLRIGGHGVLCVWM